MATARQEMLQQQRVEAAKKWAERHAAKQAEEAKRVELRQQLAQASAKPPASFTDWGVFRTRAWLAQAKRAQRLAKSTRVGSERLALVLNLIREAETAPIQTITKTLLAKKEPAKKKATRGIRK